MKIGENIRWGLLTASTVFLILFGTIFGVSVVFGDLYSQVEVFETEQEYIEFKKDLASIPIRELDIEILASEPPIIVDYTIRIPRGVEFPRSNARRITQMIDGKEWILAVIGGVCLAVGLLAPIKEGVE